MSEMTLDSFGTGNGVFHCYGEVGKLVTPVDCKSAASGIVCSTHTFSTRANSNLVLMHGYSMFVSFNGCYRN
jgi:hypothetical protein